MAERDQVVGLGARCRRWAASEISSLSFFHSLSLIEEIAAARPSGRCCRRRRRRPAWRAARCARGRAPRRACPPVEPLGAAAELRVGRHPDLHVDAAAVELGHVRRRSLRVALGGRPHAHRSRSAARSEVPVAATCSISWSLDVLDGAPARRRPRAVCASVEKIAARPTWKNSIPTTTSASITIIEGGDDLAVLAPQHHGRNVTPELRGTRGSQDPSCGRDRGSSWPWDLSGAGAAPIFWDGTREVDD